jgi:hypothetical protein
MSGEWFIAWGIYTQVAAFTFPHCKSELDSYGAQVLSLFAAMSPSSHSHILSLDKAIRVRVSEHRDLLLTDNAKFDNLHLYWLHLISTGTLEADTKGKSKDKSDFCCEDACN